jgi:hypothetical protein
MTSALLHLNACRGTETYLTSSSPNYQESVFQMVSHTLSGDYDELNMIPAVKLMEVVLQNCPGKVSALVCYVTVLATSGFFS